MFMQLDVVLWCFTCHYGFMERLHRWWLSLNYTSINALLIGNQVLDFHMISIHFGSIVASFIVECVLDFKNWNGKLLHFSNHFNSWLHQLTQHAHCDEVQTDSVEIAYYQQLIKCDSGWISKPWCERQKTGNKRGRKKERKEEGKEEGKEERKKETEEEKERERRRERV